MEAPTAADDAPARSPFVLTLGEAVERLDGIERIPAGGLDLLVAWPDTHATKPKLRYPLVVLVGAGGMTGSAIEMGRLMATTKEIRESILVAVEDPSDGPVDRALVDAVRAAVAAGGRVADEPVLVFAPARTVAASDGLVVLEADEVPERLVPSLVDGLRARLGTGTAYGDDVARLKARPIVAVLTTLRPLFAWLARRRAKPPGDPTRFLVRSEAMDRDFEVFAILPRGHEPAGDRRCPALVVLDAIIELSIVAETVDRLAAAGRIPPLVVIGIGDPRREGQQQAAIRRFEEFAPPTDGYAFDDDLGRVFRALFAVFGLDARTRINQAPGLRAFLVDELLPTLERDLPIDPADLGLLGHSAGGTFTLFALHAGSPFRRFIALSPGIGVSGAWLLRTADTRDPLPEPRRDVFLSLGSEERTNRFNVIAGIPETEAYAAKLESREDARVFFQELDGETHSSVFPRAVAQGLLAIYGERETR
jgi:enterochelin esterase-like enzyme